MGTGPSKERLPPSEAEGKGAIGNFIHTQNACSAYRLKVVELSGFIYRSGDRVGL
jgi:hypothetical protein